MEMNTSRLRRNAASRTLCSVLLFQLALAALAAQDRAIDAPWAESRLREKGIKTDTKSLIDVVLSNRESHERWLAIEALGMRREAAALDALRHVLATSPDRELKQEAAGVLAKLGDEGGKTALARLMPTAARLVERVGMAASLAQYADNPAGYTFVLQAVTSKDSYLRHMAAGALMSFVPLEGRARRARIDPSRQLLRLLKDPDPGIRKTVALHLPAAVDKGRFPGPEAKSMIEKLAKEDTEPDVRECARLALVAWPDQGRR